MAALHEAFADKCVDVIDSLPMEVSREQDESALEMLAGDFNCPPASSLERWFDAVAGLCGLVERNRYEGEAPMRLEAALDHNVDDAYAFRIQGTGPFEIDLRLMVEGLVFDLEEGASAAAVSAKFHNTVVRFLAAAAQKAREETALNVVALSGGCFANRYLTANLLDELSAAGFEVLTHRTIPCNDGGVALGQAVVAASRCAVRFREPVKDRKKI